MASVRIEGTIEIGPYGADSKSARAHQAFLVTADGERLRLRRYDGPSMRDETLEALAGRRVVAVGLKRARLFIAKSLEVDAEGVKEGGSGRAPSTSRGTSRRRR